MTRPRTLPFPPFLRRHLERALAATVVGDPEEQELRGTAWRSIQVMTAQALARAEGAFLRSRELRRLQHARLVYSDAIAIQAHFEIAEMSRNPRGLCKALGFVTFGELLLPREDAPLVPIETGEMIDIDEAVGTASTDYLQRARAMATRSIAADPEDATAFVWRGRLWSASHEYGEGIADFARAAALEPGDPGPLFGRGLARLEAGDDEEARRDLREALALDRHPAPERPLRDPPPDQALGIAMREGEEFGVFSPAQMDRIRRRQMARRCEQRNAATALAEFEALLAEEPANPVAWIDRGRARGRLGDATGAILDFTRALELDPESSRAHNNRGIARAMAGDVAGAEADLRRSIDLHPRGKAAHANLGCLRLREGDGGGALLELDRAVGLSPRDPNVRRLRAWVRAESGQLPGAIQDLDVAIEIDPNSARSYRQRGHVRKLSGDRAGAAADYRLARKLESGS